MTTAGLWLAPGTEVGAPSAHHVPFNDRSARVAGLPVPPKDEDVHLLGSLSAFTVHIVLEARSAIGDSHFQDFPTCNVQALHGGNGDVVGMGVGAHSSPKQRFININIPEPRHSTLVQQDGLDWTAASRYCLSEAGPGEGLVDRLWPKFRE